MNCPYCDKPAVFFPTSERFYSRDWGAVYACIPCGAWVGCHKGTKRPLGRLANAELRKAKIAAHAAFDKLWQGKMLRDECSKGEARRAGYKWLAEQLDIEPKKCHIGMFDLDLCAKVVEVCQPYSGVRR